MRSRKTAGYVSVCGLSTALNIVCIMLLAATPLDSLACVISAVVITPAIAKFGWKKAVPVYIVTVLLGAVIMDPSLTVLYFCVGFHPFGADTDTWRSGKVRLKLVLLGIVMGTVSAILMLALCGILGFGEEFQGKYALLVFPMMTVSAFSQGVIYRSAKKMIYNPLIKPILDDLMDH